MLLPWRDKTIGGEQGPPVRTSITHAEAAKLRELTAGALVVEIGSAYGYSAILMARDDGTRGAAHVIAVDPHEGYGSMTASYVRMRQNVAAYGVAHKVSIVRMRSSDAWPMLAALEAKPDVVFVDGDHRLAVVSEDLECGWALLPTGGVLAVHDVGEESCPAVAPAVQSFLRARAFDGLKPELTDTLWTAAKP